MKNNSEFPIEFLTHFQVFSLPLIKEFNAGVKGETIFETLVLDLRQDLETIWSAHIHSKRKNMIRKAEKTGIQIEVATNFNADFF